jgi:MoxR-like ATPase
MATKQEEVFETDEVRELVADFQKAMGGLRDQVGKVIIGQSHVVEHLLVTLLVGGHCLITGMPGTAKTLLVRTLADALGLTFKRIQFTPDLMPTDVTGTDIIEENAATGHRSWTFVKGPIFTNVLLADEINRTPPKTQAALLEAMQERSVTVRGEHHELEPPFFVLATQNPIELENRFTTRVDLPEVTAVTTAEEIVRFQWLVRQIPVADEVNRYAVNLVRATRPSEDIAPDVVKRYVNFGASVRATMFLNLAAKASALLNGRYHVTKEDVRELALPVLRHRVLCNYFAESDNMTVDDVLTEMLDKVEG